MSREKPSPPEETGKWAEFWKQQGEKRVTEETESRTGQPLEVKKKFERMSQKAAAALTEIGGDTKLLSPKETVFNDVKKTVLDQLTAVKESLEAGTKDFQRLENLKEYLHEAAMAPKLAQKEELALLGKLTADPEINKELAEIVEISKNKIEPITKRRIAIFLENENKSLDEGIIVLNTREEIVERIKEIFKDVCKENTACDEAFFDKIIAAFSKEIDGLIYRIREVTFKKAFEEATAGIDLNDLDKLKAAVLENIKISGFNEGSFAERLDQELSNDSFVEMVGEAVSAAATNDEVAAWLLEILKNDGSENTEKEIRENRAILEKVLSPADLKTLEWVIAQKEKISLRKNLESIKNKIAEHGEFTRQELALIYEGVIAPLKARERMSDLPEKEKDEMRQILITARNKRMRGNQQQDLAKIFDCDVKQIALGDVALEDMPVSRDGSEQLVAIYGTAIFSGLWKETFDFLKFIGGHALFYNSLVKNLGSLENIGGGANFGDSQVEDLGQLQYIGGNAIFAGSKIKSLGRLKFIGGNAEFNGAQVESLGQLEEIGGNANFDSKQIKDLGKLRRVRGYASFDGSSIKTLGELQTIGGEANFRNSEVEDLGQLQTIGGGAVFANSRVKNLGKLKFINGDANFFGTEIKTLGQLQSIGGNADFRDSDIENIDNLQEIKGLIRCLERNKKLCRALKKKFGDQVKLWRI